MDFAVIVFRPRPLPRESRFPFLLPHAYSPEQREEGKGRAKINGKKKERREKRI